MAIKIPRNPKATNQMSEEKTLDNIDTLLYRISKIPDGERFLNAYKKDISELQSLRNQLAAKEKELEHEKNMVGYFQNRVNQGVDVQTLTNLAAERKKNEELREALKKYHNELGKYCTDYPDFVIQAKNLLK
jgi:hypothetical protein